MTNPTKAIKNLICQAALIVSEFSTTKDDKRLDILPDCPQPIEHKYYHMEADFEKFTRKWLAQEPKIEDNPPFSYNFENLTEFSRYTSDTGFFVVRCISKDCQNLWFGPTKKKNINFERLKNITGNDLTFSELNQIPHPLP